MKHIIKLRPNKDHPMCRIALSDILDDVLRIIDKVDEGIISTSDELREAIEELRE